MCAAKMIEVYWEPIVIFYENNKTLMCPFRSPLMSARAEMYSSKIRAVCEMLPQCVGYVDVTKIEVYRPRGPNSIQQSVYYGHKRMHCFLFCMLKTPEELILFCDGPAEGRRNDLVLLNYTGPDDGLQNGQQIKGVQ